MGLESSFQSSVLEYLNGIPGCKAENVSGNASQSGRPDINGCYKGRMFKLELKIPDHRYKASKKQELELRKWKNAGCVIGVFYSMEAVKDLFKWHWDGAAFKRTIAEENECVSWFELPDTRNYD
jgi:hypothetical protein